MLYPRLRHWPLTESGTIDFIDYLIVPNDKTVEIQARLHDPYSFVDNGLGAAFSFPFGKETFRKKASHIRTSIFGYLLKSRLSWSKTMNALTLYGPRCNQSKYVESELPHPTLGEFLHSL